MAGGGDEKPEAWKTSVIGLSGRDEGRAEMVANGGVLCRNGLLQRRALGGTRRRCRACFFCKTYYCRYEEAATMVTNFSSI